MARRWADEYNFWLWGDLVMKWFRILCYQGLSPMGLTLNVQYAFGNPIITSHPSNWELYTSASEPFTFWQRINNFVIFWKYIYHHRTVFLPSQEALAKKYFGDDIPALSELEKNVSLVFVNQQLPISYLRPNVPKIMETCSFHVSKKIQTLPKVFCKDSYSK